MCGRWNTTDSVIMSVVVVVGWLYSAELPHVPEVEDTTSKIKDTNTPKTDHSLRSRDDSETLPQEWDVLSLCMITAAPIIFSGFVAWCHSKYHSGNEEVFSKELGAATDKTVELEPVGEEHSTPAENTQVHAGTIVTLVFLCVLCAVLGILAYLWCNTQREPEPVPEPQQKIQKSLIDHMDWEHVRLLGRGSYGSVSLAVNNRNGSLFAVKLMRCEGKKSHLAQLQKEVEVLSRLKHRNIVAYLGSADTERGIFLFLEYVSGGTLSAYVKEMGRLSPEITSVFTKQMLEGLEFIHKSGIIHRDLKPQNVLISVKGTVKLADFGAAFDLKTLTHTRPQTFCGTPAFLSPEVILASKHTTSSDIWSLGIVVYYMAFGDLPWKVRDKYQILMAIADRNVSFEFGNCLHPIRDFIESCLRHKPTRRPSASQLLMHAMITTKLATPDKPGDVGNPNSGIPGQPVSETTEVWISDANEVHGEFVDIINSGVIPNLDLKPLPGAEAVPLTEESGSYQPNSFSWNWTNASEEPDGND